MKQIRIIIAITAFTFFNLAQLTAADTTENPAALPVELKLAGTFNNQPLITLSFTGITEDRAFSISITDEAGIVLYSDDVKGTIFTKQFLLNTDDLGDAILFFEIKGKQTGNTAQYKVSMQHNVVVQMDLVKR